MNASMAYAILITYLLVTTPVSIADSGQRSRISKTNGIRFSRDSMYPVRPMNKGGDVTSILSNLPLVLKSPAHNPEKTKEKYPQSRPRKLLLYDSETWQRIT